MKFPTPHLERMQVRSVHDGDTLVAYVDRARDQYEILEVRLRGVYAPELSQPGGWECQAHAVAWLADHHDGSEWPFLLETFRTPKSDKDSTTLSRYVGEVRAADGTILNAAMQVYIVAQGYDGGIGSK